MEIKFTKASQLKEKPDFNKLGFGKYVTDYMFVMDYDHNSPSFEHLQQTHERMFRAIRDANPDLPIICMSRPQYYVTPNVQRRIEIIRTTVENSRARGDEKVWMLTGQQLMEMTEGEGLVDGCHPTDLGFFSMGQVLSDLLKTILNIS